MTGNNSVLARLGLFIVHRLNNDLSALTAFAEFLADDLTADHSQHKNAQKLYAGAQASAETSQMLHQLLHLARDDAALSVQQCLTLIRGVLTEQENEGVQFNAVEGESLRLRHPIIFIDQILQKIAHDYIQKIILEINVTHNADINSCELVDGRNITLTVTSAPQATTATLNHPR